MTYQQAKDLLETARNPENGKPIGNNTRLYDKGYEPFHECNVVHVVLHSTPVVEILSNGTYIINSGGYQTRTTKDRINEYVPHIKVFQEDFEWYVSTKDGTVHEFEDGMEFRDGYYVHQTFYMVGNGSPGYLYDHSSVYLEREHAEDEMERMKEQYHIDGYMIEDYGDTYHVLNEKEHVVENVELNEVSARDMGYSNIEDVHRDLKHGML